MASAGELYIALKSGYSPERILFTSPGKTREELEYAISNNIYCINVESADEARLINEIAVSEKKKVNIALRINPDFSVSGANIRMAGVVSQFGIDSSQLKEFFSLLKNLNNINVIGLHVYLGTQILSPENIVENFDNIVRLAIDISDLYHLKFQFIDVGGGYGIPYFPSEKSLDRNVLKAGMLGFYEKHKNYLENVRLISESGRFLLAESGIYVTKVLYKKVCKGSTFLTCDGGSNHHASSAFLGRYVRNNFPMYILDKQNEYEEVSIVGPLCTPTDVIGLKLKLPKAVPGDYVVIENSGAYGLTNSPVHFLSHLTPPEILYANNKAHVIREKGNLEDYAKGQYCPF